MRIRYLLLHAYGRGGTIRTTLSMASVLAERGHDVEVASVLRFGRRPQMPVSPRVRIVPLTGHRPRLAHPGTPRSALRWARRVAQRDTDTVLGAGGDPRAGELSRATDRAIERWVRDQDDAVVVGTRQSLVLALARTRTDRQVALGQEHNHHRRDARSRSAYAADYPRLDALAVLTERDARAYRATLGEQLPVHVVPNAVPHGWIPERASLHAPLVLAVGALEHRKGFDLLLRAWPEVVRRHPSWRLRILGSGPQREELETVVASTGTAGSVTLAGHSSDVAAEMSDASVLVLSSRAEGLPMVILEAMAAGLPVVSFDCPTGPADLVVDGVTGLLVPPKDPAALASALDRVLADADLRARMGGAGLERARDFDVQHVAARWEELFGALGDARGLALGRAPDARVRRGASGTGPG